MIGLKKYAFYYTNLLILCFINCWKRNSVFYFPMNDKIQKGVWKVKFWSSFSWILNSWEDQLISGKIPGNLDIFDPKIHRFSKGIFMAMNLLKKCGEMENKCFSQLDVLILHRTHSKWDLGKTLGKKVPWDMGNYLNWRLKNPNFIIIFPIFWWDKRLTQLFQKLVRCRLKKSNSNFEDFLLKFYCQIDQFENFLIYGFYRKSDTRNYP